MIRKANRNPVKDRPPADADRRAFLKKSVYAAYATPLITTLLVAGDSAAKSYKEDDFCRKNPTHPKCQ
jgi:hypothetical protein